jgi:haloalkane dehalogenase
MNDREHDHESWTTEQETTSVTVDGHDLEMAYRDEGDGDPIVFLHGIPTWSFLWRDIAPAIADERRVIIPDLVGYGNSAKHEGFDRSIRAQEQAVGDLLKDLGLDSVSFVAHDIGGGVALRHAAHEPESVEQLVLSNATCYDSWPVEIITDLGLPDTTDTPHEEFLDGMRSNFSEGTYTEASETFVEGMIAPWDSEEGQTSACRCAVATNTNHTTEIAYEDIDADLLCLWGADDPLQSIEYGERLANDIGGEVVPLDEAYHWVTEDRPEAYREELRTFLLGTESS